MIFFHVLLLSATLMTFMGSLYGSSCDEDCADKPVFAPSSLVVQHGERASVTCIACQDFCNENRTGLAFTVGEAKKSLNLISWQVDSVTEWDLSATCYYVRDDGGRCCSHLPVTVYQPPSRVSLQFTKEHLQSVYSYTLQCTVEDVAPVQNVHVTFYSGHLPIFRQQCTNTSKTPESCVISVNGMSVEEVFASQYWCEAKLDLGPERPKTLLLASKPRRDFSVPIHRNTISGTCRTQSFSLCFMFHLSFFLSCWIFC